MTTAPLSQLLELAHEDSSDRRRELMRRVTDLLLDAAAPSPAELAGFDAVLTQLAGEMETAVVAELSTRLSASPKAPARLVRRLARDPAISVAGPVLSASPVLTDEDLLAAARVQGQEHLRAIGSRPTVSAAVTDVLTERGDDETVTCLLRNQGAVLSHAGARRVGDRAAANADMQDAMADRRDLPADVLNALYFVAEKRLRETILARNAELPAEALEAALAAGRDRVAAADGALPADYADAQARIAALRAQQGLTPAGLAAMLRRGDTTGFTVALAELAEIDFPTAWRVVQRRELDGLALVAKAAGFDRALFLTFCATVIGRDGDVMARAKDYGDSFDQLPRETALRTLRFWRARRAA